MFKRMINIAAVAGLVVGLVAATPAMAGTDYVWSGGDGNEASWDTNTNWTPVGVPAGGDTATLSSNDTVEWQRKIDAVDTFTQSNGVMNIPAGEGRFHGMTINLTGGTFNATGGFELGDSNQNITLNVSGTAALYLEYKRDEWAPVMAVGGRNNQTATVNLSGGAIIINEPADNAWDDIRIPRGKDGNACNGVFNLTGGRLDMGSKHIVLSTDSASATFTFTGGRLENLDTYMLVDTWKDNSKPETMNPTATTLTQTGGVFAPGTVTYPLGVRTVNDIGTATVWGDYTQSGTAVLEIDIDGLASYDQVLVEAVASGGNATIIGIDVDLGVYEPDLGDFFDVLTADTSLDISGLTITGDGLWAASVESGSAILRLTYIPEPGTMLLLGLGACLPILRRRRR